MFLEIRYLEMQQPTIEISEMMVQTDLVKCDLQLLSVHLKLDVLFNSCVNLYMTIYTSKLKRSMHM